MKTKHVQNIIEVFSTEDVTVCRDEILRLLRNGETVVTFTKADGSTRVMMCTLNFELIPDTFHPKQPEEGSEPKPINHNLVKCFDLESMAWRSFKIDTVKTIVSTEIVTTVISNVMKF